jgi:hypothetical protein
MYKGSFNGLRRSAWHLSIALLLVVWLGAPAIADTRVALVIGIGAYQNAPPLANPVNDARAIGDALRRLSFEVTELRDPDFRALSRGLREFGIRAQAADAAVIYYAGHGVQFDRENYLIPADAKLERAHDLEYEALPLALMLGEVSQASKIGIVLLDSCRNNPFAERVGRSLAIAGRAVDVAPGMARVDDVPRNTMVVMAAKAGQIAEDGPDHSPFAAAILAHLQLPGLELSLFFRSVRDTVLRATQNRQEPYAFSSLGAEPFYFYPRPPNRPPEIGQIRPLEVLDTVGPTPLGIPRPTDPDQDPLTVRIIGLPRSGEIRVEARPATLDEAFGLDHFMGATFKPDGKMTGPIGTLDILVEDGRGGSVMGSLPIIVLPVGPQPVAEATGTKPAPPDNLVTATLEQPPAPAKSAPFGLPEARALALSLPCALVDVRAGESPNEGGRFYVSGPTLPGAAFDAFLQQLGGPGRLAGVTAEQVDPGHCPALAVVSDLVRRSRERGALRLVAPASPVPVGSELTITARAVPDGALYIDLYVGDGTVQHLRRGPILRAATGDDVQVSARAFGPPGQRLLVAIATPSPLDVGQRPTRESETTYLPALERELAHIAPGESTLAADVATVSIVPAVRPIVAGAAPLPAASAPIRATSVGDARCQGIVEHIQLGEALSDADRAIFRSRCGR